MASKLTLSIREQVILEAKQYAKDHGKSLSNIVEEYLKSLSSTKSKSKELELSELVRELKGSVKLPKGFKSYKSTLEDALLEKYLK
jgi:ribosome recycling factor